MSVRVRAGCSEYRTVLYRDHARREVENPIRRDGLAQRYPSQKHALDRTFRGLDPRPWPFVQIANATPNARRIAAAQ